LVCISTVTSQIRRFPAGIALPLKDNHSMSATVENSNAALFNFNVLPNQVIKTSAKYNLLFILKYDFLVKKKEVFEIIRVFDALFK
jgi:hypothetical protein